jgi:hypothetical protein
MGRTITLKNHLSSEELKVRYQSIADPEVHWDCPAEVDEILQMERGGIEPRKSLCHQGFIWNSSLPILQSYNPLNVCGN